MKPLRNATEKDIQALKKRLKEQKERRLLDRDAQEAFDIVNKHREEKKNEK